MFRELDSCTHLMVFEGEFGRDAILRRHSLSHCIEAQQCNCRVLSHGPEILLLDSVIELKAYSPYILMADIDVRQR
jgi:hypothetical protein